HRRSVAGAVAVGLFAGLIPGSNPVQFTAAALLAIWFRVNLPISVLVTLYSNPFTVVPLYLIAYGLGHLVLMQSGSGALPPPLSLAGKDWSQWLAAVLAWVGGVAKALSLVL